MNSTASRPGAIAAAPPPAAAARYGAIAATARDFEAVFLGEMLKPMLETATGGEDGGFDGGHGEAVFRGIMAEQIGTAMAARGGIGLAPPVERQLIRLQEAGARP